METLSVGCSARVGRRARKSQCSRTSRRSPLPSDPSTIANLRIGYKFNKTWSAHFDVLNLFNSEAHDIDYFYCSRLKSDPAGSTCSDGSAGVDDIHFHPSEPRQFRFTITARF